METDNFYTNFQEYPDVFNYKKTENMLEKFFNTEPSQTPQQAQPQQAQQPQNTMMSKGPGLHREAGGILVGVLSGLAIIALSIIGLFNLEDDSDSIIFKIIFFVILSFILLCIFITILYSVQKLNNNMNNFNCTVIKTPENEKTKINDNNIALNTVKDLGLPIEILYKLNIRDNYPICDNKNDNYYSSSNLLYLYFTMAIPIIILLITGYGLFKADSYSFFNGKISFIMIILCLFMMISLIISIGSIIGSNKLAFKCGKLNSFENIISDIQDKDNRLTTDEKNKLDIQLSKLKLNESAIICYEPGSLLKKNSITEKSFDGFVLFTYIIAISLLISLFIIIVNMYEFDSSIFNLNDDVGQKIILLVILIFVLIIVLASIIYPWAMNDDKKNRDQITAGISVSFSFLSVIVATAITTFFGN